MKNLSAVTILPVLLACALAPGLCAQSDAGCPNVRATNAHATVCPYIGPVADSRPR